MTQNHFIIIGYVALLVFMVTTGCVAPPTETQAGPVDLYNPNQFATTTTTASSSGLLVSATPFQTTATPTMGFHTFATNTPIPEDIVCLVDFTRYNMALESNISAKTFDLKNPPMYINYTIVEPYKVKGTRIVTSKGGSESTQSYEYYSPYAYLEVTARNPISGEIYTQDGFGKSYGNSLNKTIQISKSGNLLIEIRGNNVTSSVGIWVKPSGNLEGTTIDASKLECLPQNSVKKLFQYI